MSHLIPSLILGVLALGWLPPASAPQAGTPTAVVPADVPAVAGYDVALIGDLGYTPASEAAYERLIDELNSEHLAFTIHDGDIKSGSTECTDALFRTSLERFGHFAAPVVYTPGDNEWTDCHHILATKPDSPYGDPRERLTALRRLFFADPDRSLGARRLPLASQADEGYPENARWHRGPVTFATLHAIGSSNNRVLPGTTAPGDEAEYTARNAADLRWLDAAFNAARDRGDRGIVVAMQANPNPEAPSGDPLRFGFENLLAALEAHTRSFAGDVLLVHGDTHYVRVDKPLRTRATGALENFTRVETFGHPDVHWLRLTVDPTGEQLFTIHQEIVRANTDG